MKPTVYLETTIISYLAARPSRDLVVAGMQEETRQWWKLRRDHFELVVAEPVVREAALGDSDAAQRRLYLLRGIRTIPLSEEVEIFAAALMAGAKFPPKAALDATHISAATIGRAEYLLTWNCTHIASAVFRPRIESVCRSHGHRPPVICTPGQLM